MFKHDCLMIEELRSFRNRRGISNRKEISSTMGPDGWLGSHHPFNIIRCVSDDQGENRHG